MEGSETQAAQSDLAIAGLGWVSCGLYGKAKLRVSLIPAEESGIVGYMDGIFTTEKVQLGKNHLWIFSFRSPAFVQGCMHLYASIASLLLLFLLHQ